MVPINKGVSILYTKVNRVSAGERRYFLEGKRYPSRVSSPRTILSLSLVSVPRPRIWNKVPCDANADKANCLRYATLGFTRVANMKHGG